MTKEINRLRELAGLNRGDKFVLNELFDNPYLYTWVIQDHDDWEAEFKNVDGDVIYVWFEIYRKNAWVRFDRNNKVDITGQKDQFRIFATVLTIMKDFIKNNSNVGEFYFVAKEKSRVLLYRRMLNRFANENGFEFEENNSSDHSKFYLRKKN